MEAERLLVELVDPDTWLVTVHLPMGGGQYLTVALRRPRSNAGLEDIRVSLLLEARELIGQHLLPHPPDDN